MTSTTEHEVYRDGATRVVVEQSLELVQEKSGDYCQLIGRLQAIAVRIEDGARSERIELIQL